MFSSSRVRIRQSRPTFFSRDSRPRRGTVHRAPCTGHRARGRRLRAAVTLLQPANFLLRSGSHSLVASVTTARPDSRALARCWGLSLWSTAASSGPGARGPGRIVRTAGRETESSFIMSGVLETPPASKTAGVMVQQRIRVSGERGRRMGGGYTYPPRVHINQHKVYNH